MVLGYKTARFLGDRVVLNILFKFATDMESGRNNEGFILDLLIQFKGILNILVKISNLQKKHFIK